MNEKKLEKLISKRKEYEEKAKFNRMMNREVSRINKAKSEIRKGSFDFLGGITRVFMAIGTVFKNIIEGFSKTQAFKEFQDQDSKVHFKKVDDIGRDLDKKYDWR